MGRLMRISFNEAGFRQLLTSAGVKALVTEQAERIGGRANAVPSTTAPATTEPYYEIEDGTTDRARYRVHTTSVRAARHEAKIQALQKAL